MTEEKASSKEYDIYRDSLLRYLGYANEVGESFRPIVPKLVVPSYAVSFAYVCADTLDKTKKEFKKTEAYGPAIGTAVDTLLWQTLASVIVPGFTINRVVKASAYVIKRSAVASPPVVRWLPTAVGLGIIPLIIHPIDEAVDMVMDRSTRLLTERLTKR